MEQNLEKNELVELTAEIVSAYVSNNTVVASDLPGVIHNVFDALSRASAASGQPAREELRPAVPVKRSVTPEYIVCLEDGKKFKSLKRHLRNSLRSFAGGISGEVGLAARLSDGRTQLCRCPFRSCQAHGSGPAPQITGRITFRQRCEAVAALSLR